MGPGHMDPARAAEAAALLGARLAIPIHWGTYYPIHLGMQGPPAFLETPPALFEQAIREHAPGTEVRVLRPGEKTRRSEASASVPAGEEGLHAGVDRAVDPSGADPLAEAGSAQRVVERGRRAGELEA